MSERIDGLFGRLREARRAALLPYLMLGYPDAETSLQAALAALDAGADGLELGVPFSDPLADGPTIQQAGDVALQRGMNLSLALGLAARIRRANAVAPLLLMSYLNPLLAYGGQALARDAAQAGVDGLIIPDLPPEEEGLLSAPLQAHGLAAIHLLAPTSSDRRIAQVAAGSQGMLYLVSLTGVTGARDDLPEGLERFVARVRRASALPLAVGFGISTPEQARRVGRIADGVIVGSALLQRLAAEGVPGVAAFVGSLREALGPDGCRPMRKGGVCGG